jgi:hypothetical protein
MLESPSCLTIRRILPSTVFILRSIYKHYVGQSPLCEARKNIMLGSRLCVRPVRTLCWTVHTKIRYLRTLCSRVPPPSLNITKTLSCTVCILWATYKYCVWQSSQYAVSMTSCWTISVFLIAVNCSCTPQFSSWIPYNGQYKKVKVKPSRYRPGVAQRVPGS